LTKSESVAVEAAGEEEDFKLRDFQERAKEKLDNGKSIIISAPTGLGKTLAAIYPVIYSTNEKLKSRVIYTLPIRALARGVQKEFTTLSINPVVHHGEEPESNIFSERAVITTVDQYFTTLAGAPLSWGTKQRHAAAAAVLTSYTVFDEVHLLNPKNGLQLLFATLRLRSRWNLPTTVMTATLPDSVINYIEKNLNLYGIEASKKDVKDRDSWREVTLRFHENELDIGEMAEFIRKQYREEKRKIIVFVNTVDRAINLYKELKRNFGNILLAHSRFSKKHRKTIEDRIHKKFGRNTEYDGILITTQVAEAGLNISAPLVITELSPMDSIIQRAGRCARFKEDSSKIKGEVIVIKPKENEEINRKKWYAPYFDGIYINKNGKPFIENKRVTLSELTWIVLKSERDKNNEIQLNWEKERELLNICLNAIYRRFIEGQENIDLKNDLKNSIKYEDNILFEIITESRKILQEGV